MGRRRIRRSTVLPSRHQPICHEVPPTAALTVGRHPHPDVTRCAVLNTQFRDDGTVLEFYRIEGPYEEIVASLEDDPAISEYEAFEGKRGQFYLFQHSRPNEQVRELQRILRESKLIVVLPIRFIPGEGVTVHVVGKAARLREAYDALPSEIRAHTTIERVGEFEPGPPSLSSAVTGRQREVLDAALAVGYYSVPREGTAEDVARVAGCAASTASEHLRKIEANVMSNLLDVST